MKNTIASILASAVGIWALSCGSTTEKMIVPDVTCKCQFPDYNCPGLPDTVQPDVEEPDVVEDLYVEDIEEDFEEELDLYVPPKDTSNPPLIIGVVVSSDVLSGFAEVSAVVKGGGAIMGVEFYVDNIRIDTDFIPPYNVTVNTASFKDGPHNLTVFTADQEGATASNTMQVIFDNTPPKFLGTVPTPGTSLFFEDGPMRLELSLDDPTAIKNVTFRANGLLVGEFFMPPYIVTVPYDILFIDKNSLPKNVYLQYKAVDYLGQSTEESFDIKIHKRHLWTFETLGEIWSTATAMPDGTIVFGNLNNKLYRLTPEGNPVWTVTVEGSITTKAALEPDSSSVFFGALDGKVRRVNSGGGIEWTYDMGSPPGGGLTYSSGNVYVAAYSGTVYALQASNGSPQWSVSLGSYINSSPAVSPDGKVYVGCQDNKLYAISPGGSIAYSLPTGGEVWSSPVIGPDYSVYFGSNDGWIYGINQDGNSKWVKEVEGQIWGQPLVADDNSVYVASTSKYITKIDAEKGTILWKTKTEGLSYSSPVEGSDGTIYIGTTGAKIFALNPETGQVKWTYSVADSIHASPLILNDRIYFGSTDRNFYALRLTPPAN